MPQLRGTAVKEPPVTADMFPVGSLVMIPQVSGPPKPLPIIEKKHGLLFVQPPGERKYEVSLQAYRYADRRVTQAALASLKLELPGHKEVLDLVRSGDVGGVKKILEGLNETQRLALFVRQEKHGTCTTLLHIAAGHLNANVPESTANDMLRLLLENIRGFRLKDALDGGQQTPLFDATHDARADFADDLQTEHVNLLLEHDKALEGGNKGFINQGDKYGQTALMAVVKQCASSVLVDKDANPSELEEEMASWINMAQLLVKNGADVHLADNSGWTVVHHCVPEEAAGASISRSHMLRLAELCQLFITAGCPVDAKDKANGATALFWAVNFADDELEPLVRVLLRAGAAPASVVKDPGPSPGNTPLLAAQGFVDQGKHTLSRVLALLRLAPQERKSLARTTAQGSVSAATAPPKGKRQLARPQGARKKPTAAPVASVGRAAASSSADAGGPVGNGTVTLTLSHAEAAMLRGILERPTVALTETDFKQHHCFVNQTLQLRDDKIEKVFEAKATEYHKSQMLAPRFRMREISIVACYGVHGGTNISPPYTDGTAYHYLHQNLRRFFQNPWFDMPGTSLRAVPRDDPREGLRGEATVFASRTFQPWEVLAAYSGRVMTEENLGQAFSSLLMRTRIDDYVMQMRTKVKVEGQLVELLICPYPTLGNETMAINDGKQDNKKVNCGWMEVLYRGWPYVFVVAIRSGIKQGAELLLDYSDRSYWGSKQQMEFEHSGPLDALESKEMDRVRTALG